MCVSPISIPNPSRRFYQGLSRNYVQVPCGKCVQCQDSVRNDWFVRADAEFRYYTQVLHGSVWFITLTYNDEHCPVFMPKFYDVEHGNFYEYMLCFNRYDIQKFLKRVRTYIDRGELGDGKSSQNIKYIITSEYGSTTARPHYHGALFLPFKVSEHQLYKLLEKAWTRYDRSKRKYDKIGFVSFSNKGAKIEDNKCLRYICKYMSLPFFI